MSVVYIVSNNGKLSVDNGVLHYKDHSDTITKLIPSKVSQIIVLGRMEITGSAINVIMQNTISVIFLSKNGKYNGQLVYGDNKNTLLRHKQHILSEDDSFVAKTAKSIVKGKLHNQYLFMQRILRNHPNKMKDVEKAVSDMSYVRRQLENSNDIEEIRGYEGIGASIYFSVFATNITARGIGFDGRNKNPPRDPVNAVLSFLYTVLANRIQTMVFMEGLDPSVGTLHALAYGRNSLIFDLIEEFRTPIVDTLTCALFNLGTITKDDFRREEIEVYQAESENDESDDEVIIAEEKAIGVFLTEDGMRRVLTQFEKKLESKHQYPGAITPISYEKIIKRQIEQYKSLIKGNISEYMPMVVV